MSGSLRTMSRPPEPATDNAEANMTGIDADQREAMRDCRIDRVRRNCRQGSAMNLHARYTPRPDIATTLGLGKPKGSAHGAARSRRAGADRCRRRRGMAAPRGSAERNSVRYTTETTRRGDLTETVTATGTVQPTNKVEVSSELSGTVRRVLVDYNDHVTAGQVLAVLDTDSCGRGRALARRARRQEGGGRAGEGDAASGQAGLRAVDGPDREGLSCRIRPATPPSPTIAGPRRASRSPRPTSRRPPPISPPTRPT